MSFVKETIIPAFRHAGNTGHVQIQSRRGAVWRPGQLEPRFSKGAAAFAIVTAAAADHQVFPALLPAAAFRDNMIDGQIAAGFAAVLAGVVVAQINIFSGKDDIGIRHGNIINQFNNFRQTIPPVDHPPVKFHPRRPTLVKQNHRPLPGRDIDRQMR